MFPRRLVPLVLSLVLALLALVLAAFLAALLPAPIGAAPSAVEVPAPPLAAAALLVVIHVVSTS